MRFFYNCFQGEKYCTQNPKHQNLLKNFVKILKISQIEGYGYLMAIPKKVYMGNRIFLIDCTGILCFHFNTE